MRLSIGSFIVLFATASLAQSELPYGPPIWVSTKGRDGEPTSSMTVSLDPQETDQSFTILPIGSGTPTVDSSEYIISATDGAESSGNSGSLSILPIGSGTPTDDTSEFSLTPTSSAESKGPGSSLSLSTSPAAGQSSTGSSSSSGIAAGASAAAAPSSALASSSAAAAAPGSAASSLTPAILNIVTAVLSGYLLYRNA